MSAAASRSPSTHKDASLYLTLFNSKLLCSPVASFVNDFFVQIPIPHTSVHSLTNCTGHVDIWRLVLRYSVNYIL